MKRFFDKVIKTDTCWIFNGALRSNGYGAFKVNKKTVSAHRFSWELHFGKIPENLFVCHKCDNRRCVNPEHLFLGTQKDNMRDCVNKGRIIVPIDQSPWVKGHYPKNTKIPLSKALEVKKAVFERGKESLKSVSVRMNVSYQYVRDISCGRILADR